MTYSKDFLNNLLERFKKNIPLSVEEWNILCSYHKSVNPTYNEDGSIKNCDPPLE